MKFRGLRPPTNLNDVSKFVVTELVGVLNDIVHGLKKMNFEDNFESFEVDATISAGAILSIPNRLAFTPSRYIVVRNSAGMPIGDYEPSQWGNFVSVKNYGASSTTVKIIFMR